MAESGQQPFRLRQPALRVTADGLADLEPGFQVRDERPRRPRVQLGLPLQKLLLPFGVVIVLEENLFVLDHLTKLLDDRPGAYLAGLVLCGQLFVRLPKFALLDVQARRRFRLVHFPVDHGLSVSRQSGLQRLQPFEGLLVFRVADDRVDRRLDLRVDLVDGHVLVDIESVCGFLCGFDVGLVAGGVLEPLREPHVVVVLDYGELVDQFLTVIPSENLLDALVVCLLLRVVACEKPRNRLGSVESCDWGDPSLQVPRVAKYRLVFEPFQDSIVQRPHVTAVALPDGVESLVDLGAGCGLVVPEDLFGDLVSFGRHLVEARLELIQLTVRILGRYQCRRHAQLWPHG